MSIGQSLCQGMCLYCAKYEVGSYSLHFTMTYMCRYCAITVQWISNSLWAVFHKGFKIESRRAPLIIRFLGTKIKINILAENLEGIHLSKLSEKGKLGKIFRHFQNNIFRIIFCTNNKYISTYEVSLHRL